MTGIDLCVNKCKQSRSYLNHPVYECETRFFVVREQQRLRMCRNKVHIKEKQDCGGIYTRTSKIASAPVMIRVISSKNDEMDEGLQQSDSRSIRNNRPRQIPKRKRNGNIKLYVCVTMHYFRTTM